MASKRLAVTAAILCLLCAVCVTSFAEIMWPVAVNAGQEELQAYVNRVNENLQALRQPVINSLFELYPYNASLGVTDSDDADIPEGIELTFTMYASSLNTMVLRCSDADRFADLAAACIQAASPAGTAVSDCRSAANKAVRKAKS